MIIVPVTAQFSRETSEQQNQFVDELQARATSAGLRGRVAVVWPGGFIAPPPWHPFFRTLPVQAVHANVNREISW